MKNMMSSFYVCHCLCCKAKKLCLTPMLYCLWLQCVQLKSLAVYFDCDKPLMDPGKRWDLITISRWDELMLPSRQMNQSQGLKQLKDQDKEEQKVAAAAAPVAAWVAPATDQGVQQQTQQQQVQQQQEQEQHPHQFLLCPVDGMLRYVRRGRTARNSAADAEQEIHLQLVQIGMQLHQLQYQSSQKLLQEFDRYAASAPHRDLRPHCRPTTGMLVDDVTTWNC